MGPTEKNAKTGNEPVLFSGATMLETSFLGTVLGPHASFFCPIQLQPPDLTSLLYIRYLNALENNLKYWRLVTLSFII